ncbi:MAG: hypothetical protein M3Y59_22515 [Myxococcota bacterium]|nr:hypothetical protein [Myxococcota bacterium]
MTSEKTQRTQTVLLTTIAVLLSLHLVAIGVGVLWVRGQVAQLTGAGGGSLASLTESLEDTRKMAQELTGRQARLAASLDEVSVQTNEELKTLQARRDQLGPLQKGPIDKLEQAIQLMQLMSDELFDLTRHLSTTQAVLARSTRPGEA